VRRDLIAGDEEHVLVIEVRGELAGLDGTWHDGLLMDLLADELE